MRKGLVTLLLSVFVCPLAAQAITISTTPRFLVPELWTLGVETDVAFVANGAGLAIQGRYTHGLTDTLNVGGFLGTGAGRGLRVGGQATLDLFPDTDTQMGFGIGGLLAYGSTAAGAVVDFRVIPYLHRKLTSKRNEIEPYGGIALGPTFGPTGTVIGASAVVGSLFEIYQQLVFTLEIGVGIANETSYLSGGLTYFAR